MRQIEKKSTGKQLVRRSRVRVHDACKRGKQTRMAKCWVDVGEEGDAGAGKLSPVMSSATLRNLSSIVGVKRNHSMTPPFFPHLNLSLYVTQSEFACVYMWEPHYTAQAGLKPAVSLRWPWTHPGMASHFATMFDSLNDCSAECLMILYVFQKDHLGLFSRVEWIERELTGRSTPPPII